MLEINDISVQFASNHSVQAVEHINLHVKEKEKVVIVGESGSGKSILLLTILGLLPENAIVTGEIIFEKQNLLKLKRKDIILNLYKMVNDLEEYLKKHNLSFTEDGFPNFTDVIF